METRPDFGVAVHRTLEALAFSSLLAAAVAASLTGVSTLVLAPGIASGRIAVLMGLAGAGTLVIYNVDHLRDLDRDRDTCPARSDFVEKHRRTLLSLSALAALAAAPLALSAGIGAGLLCAGVALPGLFHRRLKGHALFKLAYVTLAWLAITIGIPFAAAGLRPGTGGALLALLACCGPAIGANLLATNRTNPGLPGDEPGRLRTARWLAAVGAFAAFIFPPAIWPLAAIPAAEWSSLARHRPGEHYTLLFVDGALAVGAGLCALVLLGLPAAH